MMLMHEPGINDFLSGLKLPSIKTLNYVYPGWTHDALSKQRQQQLPDSDTEDEHIMVLDGTGSGEDSEDLDDEDFTEHKVGECYTDEIRKL